jgi:hypothetical protein
MRSVECVLRVVGGGTLMGTPGTLRWAIGVFGYQMTKLFLKLIYSLGFKLDEVDERLLVFKPISLIS